MKLSSAPALVLCGLALLLLPFTILIKTSASGPMREHKKRSSTVSSIAAPTNFTVTNNNAEGAINVGATSTLALPDITEALTIDGGSIGPIRPIVIN